MGQGERKSRRPPRITIDAIAMTIASVALGDPFESSRAGVEEAFWLRPGPTQAVVAIILGASLLRIALSMMLGLGIDESYMIAAGRMPQLSYYDHPPLAWWLAWGASHAFGSEAATFVRLPFIGLFAVSTWLMYRLTTRLFSPQAGLWAAVTFNLSPVFGITSASWVLPDGPLIAALLGFLLCLTHASGREEGSNWGWWLGVGLCAGLAMLSKYTAILVLAGAVVALLSHPTLRRWLRQPQPWVALLTAVVLFLPVIVWNARHQWSSIAFQGRRAGVHGWHPFAPLGVLGGEALFILPWLWLPSMVVLVQAWRRGRQDWPGWLLACCATPAIGIFAVVGIWSNKPVLFHWAAPGYLVLFPLLGSALARWSVVRGRALRIAGAATAVLVVVGFSFLGSEVRWNWLPSVVEDFARGNDPDLAAVDWTSLKPELKKRGWIGGNAPTLATLQWHEAGKLSYALGPKVAVICLGTDPREFAFVEPVAHHLREPILVLVPHARQAQERLAAMFASVEPQPSLTLLHAGRAAMEVQVYLGRGLIDAHRSEHR